MLGELKAEQIESVIREATIGRIGCHAEGRTYVVPITYAYDGASLYAHSLEGRKIEMMRGNPDVCVEIEDVDDLANWRSVIAWGRYEELAGREAAEAMGLIRERFLPLVEAEETRITHGLVAPPAGGDHGEGPTVVLYRIRLDERSGRFEQSPS